MKLKLGPIQIFVSDIKAAKKWYSDVLGMKLVEEYADLQCLFMRLGNAEFYIETPNEKWGEGWDKVRVGGRTSIILKTTNIQQTVSEMKKKGVKFFEEISKRPWGEYKAVFSDPDGNEINLVQSESETELKYFLASPMFRTDVKHSEMDEKKLERNAGIAKALEDAGIELILPQRDIDQTRYEKKILDEIITSLKECKGVIVILSDTRGIYLEAGYAKALGKKIYGIKVEETRELSKWGHSFFDFIAEDVDELVRHIKGVF